MPRTRAAAVFVPLNAVTALESLSVEQLKWLASALPGKLPTRKADLVAMVLSPLTEAAELRGLWARLTPGQQQVVAEVLAAPDARYDAEALDAKYPGVSAPTTGATYYSYNSDYGSKRRVATPFDLLFAHSYEFGAYIPADLAVRLRAFVPLPPPTTMPSQEAAPAIAVKRPDEEPPEVFVTETERAVFHDLTATLHLIREGKITVSTATHLPTLPSVRHLRGRLLIGDYFPEEEYGRAEDAMRPLALTVLVQAAAWARPASVSSGKLELTRAGEALLAGPLEAAQVRDAWERWLKSNLLDELSRVRGIKGQQSKNVRLTKPAERKEKLVVGLRACPPGRWVLFDEFLRYLRAEGDLPEIERNAESGLRIGSYLGWGEGSYDFRNYWDVVTGSYLRAVVWEFAATLGLVDLAYTRPDETPHEFTDLDYLDEEYLSRYDGLLGLRLTPLGAYVLGLAPAYTPPAPVVETGPPLLRVLPNLDVVITDASRLLPNERALLERMGAARSEDVYRLSRDVLLDSAQTGLGLDQVQEFLALKSGVPEGDLPQTVRVFFADLARRLDALREGGRLVVLESADPYLLTELANESALRGLVALGAIGDRPVLLIPEAQEAAARRALKRLGYVPRK